MLGDRTGRKARRLGASAARRFGGCDGGHALSLQGGRELAHAVTPTNVGVTIG
jgi:hypothetical protein